MPKKERFYFIKLAGETVRFRNVLRKRGEELEPMLQMEARVSSKWLPVIRCDRGPHDRLHLDLYDKSGTKLKRELSSKDAVNAIVEVVDLLKRDWKRLLKELHHEEIADFFETNQESIKSELDNAREYLLNEAKKPNAIRESKGKGVVQFSADMIAERKP